MRRAGRRSEPTPSPRTQPQLQTRLARRIAIRGDTTIFLRLFLSYPLRSYDHRTAELLAENSPHELHQRFARLIQHEGSRGVRPGQLEAGGQRGNPDLPDRRVRADDEARAFRLVK